MNRQVKKSSRGNIEKCGEIKVEEHPEVSVVYRRQERQIYYNSMAEPDANVIMFR